MSIIAILQVGKLTTTVQRAFRLWREPIYCTQACLSDDLRRSPSTKFRPCLIAPCPKLFDMPCEKSRFMRTGTCFVVRCLVRTTFKDDAVPSALPGILWSIVPMPSDRLAGHFPARQCANQGARGTCPDRIVHAISG